MVIGYELRCTEVRATLSLGPHILCSFQEKTGKERSREPLLPSPRGEWGPRRGREPSGHGCGSGLLPQTSREGLCEGVRATLSPGLALISLSRSLERVLAPERQAGLRSTALSPQMGPTQRSWGLAGPLELLWPIANQRSENRQASRCRRGGKQPQQAADSQRGRGRRGMGGGRRREGGGRREGRGGEEGGERGGCRGSSQGSGGLEGLHRMSS